MNVLKLTAMTLLLGVSATACGNSPLFNHEKAVLVQGEAAPGGDSAQKPSENECPIAFPNSGLCASLTWETSIYDNVENTFTLRFWNQGASAAGPYRDVDGNVAVVLWMPSMGHGSAPVTVTPQGNGVYTASRVMFIMPGDWDIRIQIKRNNQIVEQALQAIRI